MGPRAGAGQERGAELKGEARVRERGMGRKLEVVPGKGIRYTWNMHSKRAAGAGEGGGTRR